MPDQVFELAFDAPNLAISPESATGAPIAGTVKLSKPDHVLGITLGMNGIGGNASKLTRSEEHTSELQSLMRISYAVFCLKKKTATSTRTINEKKTSSLKTTH